MNNLHNHQSHFAALPGGGVFFGVISERLQLIATTTPAGLMVGSWVADARVSAVLSVGLSRLSH